MASLSEIEAAVDALPADEKQELLLFIAARLREAGTLPPPHKFSNQETQAWIAEDESDVASC